MEIRTFAVNPGVASVFPWLTDVANRYEKYKFRRLTFRYKPQSSTNAGNVTLAFDFDPNDDPPASMQEATTYHDYVNSPIWVPASLTVDLANGDRLPQKNTRAGLPGADIDLNVYDVGQLHILTEGAAAATIGYVEVEYVVDLFVHQIQSSIGAMVACSGSLDATHLVGTTQAVDVNGYLPMKMNTSQQWVFTQPFEGLIAFWVVGTVMSADFAPVVASGGVTTADTQIVNAAGTTVNGWFHVRAQVGTTLTPTITATTVTAMRYYVARGSYTAFS
jgi:hypothetical protein